MKKHWTSAFIHIRRSPYQALGAILVTFLTFFVISAFALLAGGSEIALHYFETRPQVVAYLKEDVSPEQLDALRASLAQTGKVKETKYVSKEDALKIYKDQNKNDPLLLEMVTADILPASLEVSSKNISYLSEVATILKNSNEVEEVVYQEDIVNSLQNITLTLRKIGISLIAFFSLVSVFVVLIIVSMKATTHREEIEILRLIGASRWYIRWPFLIEGAIYGLTGAVMGWGMSYLVLLYATPFLVKFLSGVPLLPAPIIFMLELLGGEILVGILIGFGASMMAVKRYLK